jgi:ATP-dependent DNA helicase UvrD/PcrA
MFAANIPPLLKQLWAEFDFNPNPAQRDAILHTDGPLFLPAGPGSGKTRVLLWRAVNLIAVQGVPPECVFLSTFTEKAAFQLRNGLRALLAAASEQTLQPYDTAKLYVGTVHSLCQRLLLDRRISSGGTRTRPPVMLDELAQFLFLRRSRNWQSVLDASDGVLSVTKILELFGRRGTSRLEAVTQLVAIFNRLSEEMIDPADARRRAKDKTLRALLKCYAAYLHLLTDQRGAQFTDLSLIQQIAARHLRTNSVAADLFKHVIIDEYQDTNPVQEEIFFQLARGSKNICIVGDDDQALYRFRGATVENFVDFPERCRKRLGVKPTQIVLGTNYRSCAKIVQFYNRFIIDPSCNWRKRGTGFYRVMDKRIAPFRKEKNTAVVASNPGAPEDVADEIADLVKKLIDARKVEDPNQIAFLFPSLKSPHVVRLREALDEVGLKVYAPRAGQFVDVPEAKAVFGLLLQVFRPSEHRHPVFNRWLSSTSECGEALIKKDEFLRRFVKSKRDETKQIASDYDVLVQLLEKKKWSAEANYDPDSMPGVLANASGLSTRAQRALRSGLFARFARQRVLEGRPLKLGYAVTRATSLDWNVLDFFYQLAGFKHFKKLFDRAEAKPPDEGPVCNLSLVSQYLARFLDQYPFPISGENIRTEQFVRNFANFLYVLFRRGESEYEDVEDPFPKGRIPFITIHQSKGLEFPVVVLGNLRKDPKLQHVEEMVSPLLMRKSEPLDRMAQFDVMRLFYVALSRAKNLLVLAHYEGRGQRSFEPFNSLLDAGMPRISKFEVSAVPAATVEEQDVPRSYSYTGDFLLYRKCPRQYMLFRKYGFVPSRTQTMFFGSLVHQTLEDLHQHLIAKRRQAA